MTQVVAATAVLGPGKTGLTIGLRVLNIDGTEYAAFSTTGVAETSTAGTYRKAGGVSVPDAGGYIVWGEAATDYAEATVDAAPSAADNAAAAAAAILITPANKLLTDASGRVEIAGATNNTLDALLTAVQGTDGDTLKTLSDQIDSVGAGAGLNAQEVRDAMKLAPSAGAAADGSIDNLLAALPAAVEAELTGYQVNVQPVVGTDGQITLYQGYDYNSADNRAVEFTVASPDFTGATTALKFDSDSYAGSVVNPGLTTQLLRFEFTAVETAAMTAGHHAYRLEVTRAGRLLLEETGVINVKE